MLCFLTILNAAGPASCFLSLPPLLDWRAHHCTPAWSLPGYCSHSLAPDPSLGTAMGRKCLLRSRAVSFLFCICPGHFRAGFLSSLRRTKSRCRLQLLTSFVTFELLYLPEALPFPHLKWEWQ